MKDLKGSCNSFTREMSVVIISEYLGRKKKPSNVFTMSKALSATSSQCNLSVKLLDGNKCHRT